LTEIPEHLLQRSRARRAALGLGGGDDAPAQAATPAKAAEGGAKTPAKAAAAAPVAAAKKPEVVLSPEVRAANARKKIPWWAASVLIALPLWAFLYVQTLSEPGAAAAGAFAEGELVYAKCAGCHGAGGGGAGAIPALNDVVTVFPDPAQQVEWISKGSEGFRAAGVYGATNKPVQGGMPAWGNDLTAKELMSVVLYTRVRFGGQALEDLAQFEEATEAAGLPAKILPMTSLDEILKVINDLAPAAG
jgi:mono/diheme cytochrome c family protein